MNNECYRMIKQVGAGGWLDKKCYWCGEYFNKGDEIALVVIGFKFKKIYKKLSSNIAMHMEEFNKLEEKHGNNYEKLVHELGKHVTKRVSSPLTKEQTDKSNAFREACRMFGFNVETRAANEIHMRKSGTSLAFYYNERTGSLIFKYRGKLNMYEQMHLGELRARVFNKMQELLGTDERDDYTVKDTVSKAVNTVNKMMGIK